MPAAAVITAATARHRAPSARPGAVCAAIGLGCNIGTHVEPVTRRPRSWSPATRLAIGVNLAELVKTGRPADADDQLQHALSFFRSVGASRFIREAEELLAAPA